MGIEAGRKEGWGTRTGMDKYEREIKFTAPSRRCRQ